MGGGALVKLSDNIIGVATQYKYFQLPLKYSITHFLHNLDRVRHLESFKMLKPCGYDRYY